MVSEKAIAPQCFGSGCQTSQRHDLTLCIPSLLYSVTALTHGLRSPRFRFCGRYG